MDKQREKLIELLHEAEIWGNDDVYAEADILLANGVIVPLVTIGQKAYAMCASFVWDFEVEEIEITKDGIFFGTSGHFSWYSFDEIGKTVFLSREDAEKSLEERKEK